MCNKLVYLLADRMGEPNTIRLASSGPSWKILRSLPKHVSNDITTASRSGSIGGLVT